MVGKAIVLFLGAHAVPTLVLLAVIRMPGVPLLRYSMLALPLLSAGMAVACWYRAGAPGPAVTRQRSAANPRRRSVSGARPLPTRAG